MKTNHDIQKEAIRTIAQGLGELNEKFVYVGGAVVGLYGNDMSGEDVRPTKDIDITISIATVSELETLRQKLKEKGFRQTTEDNVICRFRYKDFVVDVMSTTAVGWAPANPWFAPGFLHKLSKDVSGEKILLLSLPYFLASKFTAYHDRGGNDPRMSHDFEDIVYILNNVSSFASDISTAPDDVRSFLIEQFRGILNDDLMKEAIEANLYYFDRAQRFQKILVMLSSLCEGESRNF